MNIENDKGIIYSTDTNISYNVRNKCAKYDIDIDYVENSCDVALFIMNNSKGIVFINYADYVNDSSLKKYIECDKNKDFKFVFIGNNFSIDCNKNSNCFSTNVSDIENVFIKIKESIFIDNNLTIFSKSSLYKNVVNLLEPFNFAPNHVGYTYIKDSIIQAVEKDQGIINFSGELYPSIASMYKTTTKNVEKNISSAIKKAYEKNPKPFELDDNHYRVITTNVCFLNYIIEKVKMKCIECVD